MADEMKILVVDDEIAVCNSCVKTLSREGYSVDYTLNGEEALKKLTINNYDLVITDLKMPKVDGMQLLKTVKTRWPEVNVIMITGYGTIRSAVEAMKLGAFDYVSKPFTSEELAGAAERALGLTKINREEETPRLYLPVVFRDLKISDFENMWCIPEHAWIRVCDDGSYKIGLDAVYIRLLGGEIKAIELTKVGKHLRQGESCALMTSKGKRSTEHPTDSQHNLWCPLSGIVVEINTDIQKDLSLLISSPYDRGWLLNMRPTDLKIDLENLKPFKESIGGRVAMKNLKKDL